MLKLVFEFDGQCPAWVKEYMAADLIDGHIQFWKGDQLLFTDESAPVIELAGWLVDWLAEGKVAARSTKVFFPDSYTLELFRLVPEEGSHYALFYTDAETEQSTHLLTAGYATYYAAFMQFISDLRLGLQQVYSFSLDNILTKRLPSK